MLGTAIVKAGIARAQLGSFVSPLSSAKDLDLWHPVLYLANSKLPPGLCNLCFIHVLRTSTALVQVQKLEEFATVCH